MAVVPPWSCISLLPAGCESHGVECLRFDGYLLKRRDTASQLHRKDQACAAPPLLTVGSSSLCLPQVGQGYPWRQNTKHRCSTIVARINSSSRDDEVLLIGKGNAGSSMCSAPSLESSSFPCKKKVFCMCFPLSCFSSAWPIKQ